LKLSPKQSDWFSTQPARDIYRIHVQPNSAKDQQPPQLISVFCREVPSLWKNSAQLKQPIQLRCFSFRRTTAAEQEANPEAMFYLAERVSWKLSPSDLEESAELHPTIPDRWVELAKVGWDLSWFDTLAANNQKRLSNDEAEPLLKMLQITKAEGNHQPAANMMVSAIDSMKKPVDNLAAAIDWQIRLVSGSVVDITRDGVESKYYQLDGFAKIPNQTVNYTIPDTGQSITFTNEFPVTIVTLFDEQYVPLDRLEAGEKSWQIGKTVQVQGRFLRLWSYESQRLSSPQSQSQSRQVAPLVVAGHLREANLLPEVSRTSLWSVALMGCAMLSVMVWVLSNFFKKSTRSTGRLKNP
jgi:hypothetical protein